MRTVHTVRILPIGSGRDIAPLLHYYIPVKPNPNKSRRIVRIARALGVVALVTVAVVACTQESLVEVTDEMKAQALAQIEQRELPDITNWDMERTDGGARFVKLATGDGARAWHGQKARVHYYLWLTDGTLVESTREAGVSRPQEFEIGSRWVIQGWTEVLLEMNVGDRLIAHVPSRLAYGRFERPGIPANSDLIFYVELLRMVQ